MMTKLIKKYKPHIWVAYSIFGFVLLRRLFESIIDKVIESQIFGGLEDGSCGNDIVIILMPILGFLFYYLLKYRERIYVPSLRNTIFLSLITIAVTIYRFSLVTHHWNFIPFYISNKIKYIDIIYFFTLYQIGLHIYFYWNKRYSFRTNLAEDISDCDRFFDDFPKRFSTGKYIERIVTLLKNSQFETAFAIGIIGYWGKGKTTFLKGLEEELKKEKYIPYEFTPWDYSQTAKNITVEFFAGLSSVLSPYHSSLSDLLKKYVENISEVSDQDISGVLKKSVSMLSLLSNDNTKDLIRKALEEIGQKVVIYIDDIDRLDKDEIIEVFKLVRVTANFKNLIFVLCYDKQYVENALKDLNDHKSEVFIEKIIQLEIDLPLMNNSGVVERLNKYLEENFGEEFKELRKRINLASYFKSHRDVNRFINSFNLNYHELKKEVDFSDFLVLEVLRIKYNYIYNKLSVHQDEIVELKALGNNNLGEYTYHLKTSILELYKNDENIKELLSELFPTENHMLAKIKSRASIQLPVNYDKYFNFQLIDGQFSRVKFSSLRADGKKEPFFKQIQTWIKGGDFFELRTHLLGVKDFQNRGDFELMVTALFYLEHNWNLDEDLSYSTLWFKDEDELEYLLKDSSRSVRNKLYTDEEGYRTFLKSLFVINEDYYPFDLERSLIYKVLEDINHTFPLNSVELEQIMKNYFEHVLEKEISFNDIVWNYFRQCEKKESLHGFDVPIKMSFVKDLLIKFAQEKDLRGFLSGLIIKDNRRENYFCLNSNLISLFFNNSIEELKEFLNKHIKRDEEFIAPFLSFINKQEKSGPDNYIDFVFPIFK